MLGIVAYQIYLNSVGQCIEFDKDTNKKFTRRERRGPNLFKESSTQAKQVRKTDTNLLAQADQMALQGSAAGQLLHPGKKKS